MLLNDATKLLQYAGGLIDVLADMAHEAEAMNYRKMAFALEGTEVLTRLGVQCVSHAHEGLAMKRATTMRSPGVSTIVDR